MLEERIPPQSIDAEQAVLGAVLIENEAINIVSEFIAANDFYREAHRVIFSIMMNLYHEHEPIDLITIVDALKKEDKLESVGGIAYITSLANSVATAANVKYHAKIVSEKSVLRKLINVSTEIAGKAYEGSDEVEDQLDNAEKRILEIASNKTTSDYTAVGDMLFDAANHLAQLAENKGQVTGLSTGFVDLDKLTSGLQPSDFIILAARPSMGKTAFSLNLVQNVALRSHKKIKERKDKPYTVAFFSLEMSKEQLLHRMLCAEAQIDSQRLRNGELSEEDWGKVWDACNRMADAKIIINDTPGITALEMRSVARRIKAEYDLDLIVVDYLQLMQGSGKSQRSGDNRQTEVSEISRSLKALARELKVPVIALSQLSRSVEARQVKRPMLSDLRESGSLEQDADIVAFLYREDYYNKETENQNITELIIAKHRNGPVDTVNLFFHKQFTKFVGFSKMKE